jgi:hypothetical protein
MEIYFRNPGKSAKNDVLDARLGCRRGGDRVSIAAKSCRHPKDVNLWDRRRIPPIAFAAE